jgi:carboxyl-terminal processing protease
VQTIIPIQGHGALRLTTARYYTPSGRSIQAKGIEPDIEVEQAKVEAAEGASPPRNRSEADLRRHLRGPDEQSGAAAPKAAPKATPKSAPKAPEMSQVTPPASGESKEQAEAGKDPAKVEDYQLAYALNLLRGATLFAPKASN